MPRPTPLTEVVDEYLDHLTARNLAPNTVRCHRQLLGRALACWGNIQTTSITSGHVDRLFRSNDWTASTRNLYLSVLRAFFAFCRRESYIGRDFDPTQGWRNQRVARTERLRVPIEQFPALLDACAHPRDRAICALGLFTFCRGGELQTLRVRDLDLAHNAIHIYRHKTEEEDVLPVCIELADEMKRWLSWYRTNTESVLNPGWFLVPSKGPNPTEQNPITGRLQVVPGGLADLRPTRRATHPYRAVQRALGVLGYPTEREGEHTLRRSGARALFDTLRDAGYDGALMRVASMLGHKDVRVTQRYLGLDLERTQRNETIAGQAMFPSLSWADADVIEVDFDGDRDHARAGM